MRIVPVKNIEISNGVAVGGSVGIMLVDDAKGTCVTYTHILEKSDLQKINTKNIKQVFFGAYAEASKLHQEFLKNSSSNIAVDNVVKPEEIQGIG